MSFLKKNFIWLLLAVVLAGEGFFTYMLLGKQATAKKESDALALDIKRRDDLRIVTSNYEARLAALQARRQAIEDERGECTLFLWARDQAIEQLFVSPELAPAKPTPWRKFAPDELGLFRLAYQKVYDTHVAALAGILGKMRGDRTSVGFVPANEFTKQGVTLGDIYLEQKDFWIRKMLVETAAAAGLRQIEQLAIRIPVRPAAKPGHPAPSPTNVSDVEILIRVAGTYRSFVAFLQSVSESELGFRVRKIDRVERVLSGAAAGPGGVMSASAKAAAEKAVTPPTQGVLAELYLTLPDSNVAISTITFPAARFPKGKADAVDYVTKQIGELESEVRKYASAASSPTAEPAAAATEPAGEGKEFVFRDELMPGGRDYTFGSAEEMNEWRRNRPKYEAVRLQARLRLWERALALLNAGERVSETGGVVINVRPEEHLVKQDQRYTFVVDRVAGVSIEFGLLTFAPNVSGSVVRKTGSN